MKTKKCIRCKDVKPVSDFYKHDVAEDGYQSECKVCMKKRSKAYYEKKKQEKQNDFFRNLY